MRGEVQQYSSGLNRTECNFVGGYQHASANIDNIYFQNQKKALGRASQS